MPKINISFSKEKFLPIYLPLVLDPEEFDIDFLYGGRDSGKSRHIAMQLILECMQKDYFKFLMIRKVLNTVRDSQFSLIKGIIEEWGLLSFFKFNESRLEIVCVNGNGFYGRGLDDVGRIKSFNNPSGCWIEEGNQITSEDFTVVLTSLRSNEATVKTYFSFNPECDVSYTEFWLWQEYFMHTEELSFKWTRTIVVDEDTGETVDLKVRATHATFRNNPYCKPQRKALYQSYKVSKNNAYWYQTYTLGLWGYRRPGGEFYKCFEEDQHTLDFTILPNVSRTFHIVLDNNVNPYISVQLWQVDLTNKALLQVDELPCTHPENTATKAALKTIKYLERLEYNDKLFIYGDPSANAKSTTDDEGRSFFDKYIGVIKAAGYDFVNRVGRSAPSVSQSGSFVNEIFEAQYLGWKIFINKTCRKSIEDYNMTVENAEGGILKKKVTNKDTGASYEKHGHMTDCFIGETLVETINGPQRIDQVEVGDFVLTRKGYRPILNVWNKGLKSVVKYNIGDNSVVCTPNHKFFTVENDFASIELINKGTFCILDDQTQSICHQLLSITTDSDLSDIQNHQHEPSGFITQDGLKLTGNGLKNDYMSISMNVKSDLFLKNIISITLMRILKTMRSVTISAKQLNSIYQTMVKTCQLSDLKEFGKTSLKKLYRHQKSGTGANPGWNGIDNTLKISDSVSLHSEKDHVKFAAKLILNKLQCSDFAPITANHHLGEDRELITKQEHALFVNQDLNQINTLKKEHVPGVAQGFQEVYDIEVEGEHEFFANDILVHNCSRYFITTILKAEYTQYLTRRKGIPQSGGTATVPREAKVTL